MLAEFSVVPVGVGESVGERIAAALRIVDESGLPYKLTPMGTVVEGEWDEVMNLVRRCHEEILSTSPRSITSVRIDDRKGRKSMMESKVTSVERAVGHELKK